MKSWWNWLAKDVKRHPKAVTKPPKTAVKRVDFLLQIPMVMGDISNERHDEVAPSHPVTQKIFHIIWISAQTITKYTWICWLYIHIHHDIILNSSSKIVSALPTAPHYNIHIIFSLRGWATSSEHKMNIRQAMVQRFLGHNSTM